MQTKAIRESIGARIRTARIQAGLSQEELAAQLGRNQQSISQLENGERNLPAGDMLFLARELKVSILYFYEGLLDKSDLDETDDLREALVHEFSRLPTLSLKKAAVQLLRALSDTVLTHDQ